MKKLVLTMVAIAAFATSSLAQSFNLYGGTTFVPTFNSTGRSINISSGINNNVVYQQGYTRSNGTYVEGHYKTVRNNTNWDNFSTVGNVNSFTGTIGTIARDYTPNAYNYGSGKTIYTGSKGGQYYINSNGNKTYVPKRSNMSIW